MSEHTSESATSLEALAALDLLVRDHPEALFCACGDDGVRVPVPSSLLVHANQIIPVPAKRGTMIDLAVPADSMRVLNLWNQAHRVGFAMSAVHAVNDPERLIRLTLLDTRRRHGVWLGVVTAPEDDSIAPTAPPSAGALELHSRPRTATVHKNRSGVITAIDERTTNMLGWHSDDMVGKRTLEFLHPDDHARAVTNWMEMLSNEEGNRVRFRHRCRDGGWLWVEVENDYHDADEPDDVEIVTRLNDISDEMAAHEAVHQSEQLFRRLAEAFPAGVLQVDTARNLVFANASLGRMLGVVGATTLAEHLATIVPSDRVVLSAAFDAVLDDGTHAELEVQARLPQTLELRRFTVTLTALTDEEGAPGAIVCVSDITESARMREALEVQATFDALTGCYNRASIMAAIDHALAVPDTRTSAVIFIDLDKFKPVNDTHGHGAGDELLVHVADRLKELLRADDIVGRIGGDEFLLLCRGLEQPDRAIAIAERVAEVLRGTIGLSTGVVHVQASIGVAFFSPHSTSDSLVAQADAAMYESKRRGDGRPVTSGVPTDTS